MNLETIHEYHRLKKSGQTGSAALLMAYEYSSGRWLGKEVMALKGKEDRLLLEALSTVRKEGFQIAEEYFRQAFDACKGIDKLRAVVGLGQCLYGDPLYEFPPIRPVHGILVRRRHERNLIRFWSHRYEKILENMAEQGSSLAEYALARVLELGLEGTPDIETATRRYEKAIRKGSNEACWRLGWVMQTKGKVEIARKWYKLGVERGSEEAKLYLSKLEVSLGKIDDETALLLHDAALNGLGEAWICIANLLKEDVKKGAEDVDVKDILMCYHFAARCGAPDAYDWLLENEPVNDKYKLCSSTVTRERIRTEYTYWKWLLYSTGDNGSKCFDAYKYFVHKNLSDVLAITTLEHAERLGCVEARYELARCYDTKIVISRSRDCVPERFKEKNDLMAIVLYQKSAEQGHVKAMLAVAKFYKEGRILVQNDVLSFKWMVEAANHGSVEAQILLAEMFKDGVGCTQSDSCTIVWLKNAYDNTELNQYPKTLAASACLLLGSMLESCHDHCYDSGFIVEVYERAAFKFNSEKAYWRLGEIYEGGMYGRTSIVKAAEYYCRSLQGCIGFDDVPVEASYCLTLAYLFDVGQADDFFWSRRRIIDLGSGAFQGSLNRDLTRARRWYKHAKEAGAKIASWRYGEMCEQGIGGEVDLIAAEEAYVVAASLERQDFALQLADKYYKGVFTGHPDYVNAIKWYSKSAKLGEDVAAFKLGGMYLHGKGVERDVSKAVSWYLKSKDDQSYLTLARLYRDGIDVQRDLMKALWYYAKSKACAARLESAAICYDLGCQFDRIHGESKDIEKALKCFYRAAILKHSKAQMKLAEMYESGYGIRRNLSKTVYWYYWAGENGEAEGKFRFAIYCELGFVADIDMNYVKRLYTQAADLGCERAKVRLTELSHEAQCGVKDEEVSMEEDAEGKLIKDFADIQSIRNCERATYSEVIRSITGLIDNTNTDSVNVLQQYRMEHDLLESSMPYGKFNIGFYKERASLRFPFYDDDPRKDDDDVDLDDYTDDDEVVDDYAWPDELGQQLDR